MKATSRETMERAIGIIEGTSYGASQRVIDALSVAVEMLDTILNDEESNHDTTRKSQADEK